MENNHSINIIAPHGFDMVQIPFAWVEVRHAPGFDDDGQAMLATNHKPEAISPEIGINGHVGSWTTVHAVYYDSIPHTDN